MRAFITFLFFTFIAFPVFSQSALDQRLTGLSETMGTSVNRTAAKLADFDSQIKDDGDVKVYTVYRRQFEYLSKALAESESRLNLYLRTNERSSIIKAERDEYEELFKMLQTAKSEFDNHIRSSR